MDRKKRLNPESRRAYLEGLRKYRENGVPILIDGKEADESQVSCQAGNYEIYAENGRCGNY